MIHPSLLQRHVQDARLYADRTDMVRDIVSPGGVIAELGVAIGYFSRFLIDELAPSQFVAFDIFTIHEHPVIWGQPQEKLLGGKTHIDFYRTQFPGVDVEIGLAHERIASYPDHYFDLIYVDADHSYESVKADLAAAAPKLRQDGTMIFNDYIMYDHLQGGPYGVVQAVNEMICEGGWRVVGLSLQRDMFCDLAVVRTPHQGDSQPT